MTILVISRNPRLLALRSDALGLAGYAVAAPSEPRDAVLLASKQSFDAIIIGHSVERDAREGLIHTLRDLHPNVPIVFVYENQKVEEPLADASVDVTHGPTALLDTLDRRLVPVRRIATGGPV